MPRPARRRTIPLRYDDGFRGAIAMAVSAVFMVVPIVARLVGADVPVSVLVASVGVSLTVFSLVYVVWTHRLYAATPEGEALRIAAEQHRGGPSRMSRVVGFGGPENWAMSAAVTALVVAIATAVVWYTDRMLWLPLIALGTAALSWVLMAYAFALKYFRLHAAGERIEFDIDEEPGFPDFVSLAVMIAAAGALSAATPRTRAGLSAVRTQTVIGFGFNSLVVAMTVSLVVGLLGVA
ncbi:DUF1345 domain-containing protein [Microbacterium neungamense]|uniref:DUF1345 domain-containing protein n=1 Tax=Microbacterium neungamense TaxID=2810535 RepID=UPI00217EFCED|nr:DUF1345 domain-containing protein [Microbacterium neungamense]UWF77062.1 DUF1345 domain-containing protein [Microbacterium neungamense]